jgi:hypothetical protein
MRTAYSNCKQLHGPLFFPEMFSRIYKNGIFKSGFLSSLRYVAIPLFLNCLLVLISGAQGTAINLDNSNQANARRVILNTSASLKPNLVTAELWAKSGAWYRAGGDNTMLSCTQAGGYAIYVQAASGNLLFIAYANGAYQIASVAASGTLVNGQWHHIAGTWDGSTAKLYVDGVLKGSSATLGSSYNIAYGNTANYLFAGAESAGTGSTPEANRYFDGQLDEIKIWSTARTQAELKTYLFKSVPVNATGLLAYYNCNDASGTTLTNSCTNTSGLNGTLVSAAWYSPSPVQFAGNALRFDGVDDQVSTSLSVSGLGAFTLEGWIYPATAGSRIGFFGQNDAIEFGFSDATTITGYTANSGGSNSVTWAFDNSTFPMNTWHHVAFTADGTNMRLYVDGLLKATAANALSNYGTSADLFNIGGSVWDATGNNLNGAIDEVRVWNVARTQSQIQAMMNNEPDPALQSGLLAYYTFNQGITAGDNTGLLSVTDIAAANNGTLMNMALSGSSSNFIAQKSGLFILPLSWTSFTAKKINEAVQLNWATAQEQFTKDFIVQYSNEGGGWTDIGTVAAAPGDNGAGEYSFTHLSPVAGNNYYRIQQRDRDGKYSFSKVVTVAVNANTAALRVFPNPVVNGELNIYLPGASGIYLYSNDGRLVLYKKGNAGINKLAISNLSKGVYQLRSVKEIVSVLVK